MINNLFGRNRPTVISRTHPALRPFILYSIPTHVHTYEATCIALLFIMVYNCVRVEYHVDAAAYVSRSSLGGRVTE